MSWAKTLFSESDPLVARAMLPLACDAMRKAGEKTAADLLESAAPDALQYLSLPSEHWRRVRTNNVQERANRELKRRYRSVQSFPSRSSLLRLLGAVMLEEEVSWGQHRVFSTKSVARAWEVPETPTPDGTLAREIARAERKAKSAVDALVDRFPPKG